MKNTMRMLIVSVVCAVQFALAGMYVSASEADATPVSMLEQRDALVLDAEVQCREPDNFAMAQEIIIRTNALRESFGLEPLRWDEELFEAAAIRAAELPVAFSHTRPDGSDWFTVNLTRAYGENLAKYFTDSESVVVAWINSLHHLANLVYPEFVSAGVAVYRYGGKLYIAFEFGRT